MPPALFLFLEIALAIWGLLCFLMNFKIIFSISVGNSNGIFIRIAWNLYITLGSPDILAISTFLVHEHRLSFYLFVSSYISFIDVLSFQCTDLSLFCLNLLNILLFWCHCFLNFCFRWCFSVYKTAKSYVYFVSYDLLNLFIQLMVLLMEFINGI